MNLIAPSEVVAAAKSSTQAYLNLLTDRSASAPPYPVDRLKEQHVPAHIEGRLYFRYAARLPAGLKIRPDAHALFTPKGSGRMPIPTRVLEYNTHTGMAKLGFVEKLSDESGRISIAQSQALRRWQAWLERCGEEINTPEDISMPPIDVDKALKDTQGEHDMITGTQLDAVRTMLSAPLSFVHGPAGAGKTTVVLPRAARALIAQGKRILIAAWRSAAVDQALTALILDGVDEEKILRMGVPTAPFMHAYPKCCEMHAGEQSMAQTSGHLRRLQAQMAAIGRLIELKEELDREQELLNETQKQLSDKDREYHDLSENVRRFDMKSRGLHNELFRSQSKITGERRKRSELHMPEFEREKKAIETEMDFISRTVKTLRQELDRIGGLSSLIGGGKKKELDAQITQNEKYLEELKAKLDELGQRIVTREGSYKNLTGHIYDDESIADSMDNKLNRLRDKLSELRPQHAKVEAEWKGLRSRVKDMTEAVHQHAGILQAYASEHGIEDIDAAIAAHKGMRIEAAKAESQLAEFQLTAEGRSVIGMTLDAFIGFSVRDMVDVDWVFVAEAHCAPIIKVLPLLTLKRPIAMLGELRHLPPYCDENADMDVRAWWAKPAPFLEDAFRQGQTAEALIAQEEPQFELTKAAHLTQSFTIGPEPSGLMERYIYAEPVKGSGAENLPILIRHCEPWIDDRPQPGVNESEAEEAIGIAARLMELSGSPDTPLSLAILTPGEAQADLIRARMRKRDERLPDLMDVLAVHRALGLEWEQVIFSVTSTRRLGEASVSPELLCSAKVAGRSLLHTVLTRGRRRLIILMDRADWAKNDPPCLLTELARSARLYDTNE